MKSRYISAISIVFLLQCSEENGEQQSNSPGQQMYVQAEGGLRMRDKPELDAQRILTIPDGAPVLVFEAASEEVIIAGNAGKWRAVTYQGQRGFVFDAFLNHEKSLAPRASGPQYQIQPPWHGKYLSGRPNECIPDYAAELYVNEDSVWCIGGETGEIFLYCIPKSVADTGRDVLLHCRQDVDVSEFSSLGLPPGLPHPAVSPPAADSIVLRQSMEGGISVPCGGPPGRSVPMTKTDTNRQYCNQL